MSIDGQQLTVKEEVVALENTSLEAALFEPPPGYTPANNKAEVIKEGDSENAGVASYSPLPTTQVPLNDPTMPALAPPSAGISDANVNRPKQPGVVRIGISRPTAEMGKDFDFSDAPVAVMNTLKVALTDDNVEAVLLQSALPEREAKQAQCDYVFVSKVMRKKGGGGMFGGMGPMLAGAAAGMIPGVGGMIGSVAASTVITATTMSGGFKSKDEITFEYRFVGVDGTVVIPVTTTKQKAKKDGEDVLTPQISAAAKLALEKIAKPQP